MAGDSCSVRIVLLGGSGVGKTSIIKRFLFHTFCDKYRATVEDLFFKEFNYGTLLLKVSDMQSCVCVCVPCCRISCSRSVGLVSVSHLAVLASRRVAADFQVDFLDTAGDMQFPAMRRLSITNAQAFLLVYSISDPNSLSIVKNCFEEIREVRSDYQVRAATGT